MTRRQWLAFVRDSAMAVAFVVSLFIISAALVGLWLGLVWRFVWVTA